MGACRVDGLEQKVSAQGSRDRERDCPQGDARVKERPKRYGQPASGQQRGERAKQAADQDGLDGEKTAATLPLLATE